MRTAGKFLGFDAHGLRGLHFFIKGLEYPIVAAEYSSRDALAIQHLNKCITKGLMDSEQICRWCINHGIYFSFVYGVRLKQVFRNPAKAWRYLQMRGRLKEYSARRRGMTPASGTMNARRNDKHRRI